MHDMFVLYYEFIEIKYSSWLEKNLIESSTVYILKFYIYLKVITASLNL